MLPLFTLVSLLLSNFLLSASSRGSQRLSLIDWFCQIPISTVQGRHWEKKYVCANSLVCLCMSFPFVCVCVQLCLCALTAYNCALPLPLSLRQARLLAHPGKPGFAEVHNYNQSYGKGTSETCMSFSLQCPTAEQYVSPPIRTPQLSTLFSAQPHCRGGHILCSSQQSSNMHTYRACSKHSRNQDVYSL